MKHGDLIKYDLDCYDRHCSLKPPPALLAALAFACRDFLLPLVVALGSLKGGAGYDVDFLLSQHHTLAVLTQVPALLVIYAMIRRVPGAEAPARWIWKHGRLLVGAALLADVILAAALSDVSFGHLRSGDAGTLARLAFDGAILTYLARSRRLKDVFADFPAATP